MKPIFRFVVPAAIAFIYIYGMATLHGIDPPAFYKTLSFPAGSVAAFRHSACFFLPNLAGIPKSPFNIALSPTGC